MFILFAEKKEGVFLCGVNANLMVFSAQLGISADDWSRHESEHGEFYEYLPMKADEPLCYVAYWVNSMSPVLAEIPVAFDDEILDA